MSVQADHAYQSFGVEPPPSATVSPNWTIDVSDIRTIKVSNISLAVSENDIKQFFSFSGDVRYVEMQREYELTQLAYVTFKDSQGADTAKLLSGATIADLSVTITPVKGYQLPPEAQPQLSERKPPVTDSAVQKAEAVVSTMLAKGYVLGKDAFTKAKAFDEQHHWTSNASATVASIDNKIGLSEKLTYGTAVVSGMVKEMDEVLQVSEMTKSAFAAAEKTAANAGSAIMGNHYVSRGTSWVSSALNVVTKAAGDVTTMTKEKVEKAEEEKKETLYRVRTGFVADFAQMHLDESSVGDLPVVMVDSEDDNKLGII